MLTPERIAELRRLMEMATPGPWKVWRPVAGHQGGRIVNPAGDAELGNWMVADLRWMEDAELVTAMRNDFAALLDEAERAAEAREAAARLILECTNIISEATAEKLAERIRGLPLPDGTTVAP